MLHLIAEMITSVTAPSNEVQHTDHQAYTEYPYNHLPYRHTFYAISFLSQMRVLTSPLERIFLRSHITEQGICDSREHPVFCACSRRKTTQRTALPKRKGELSRPLHQFYVQQAVTSARND